MFMTNVIQRDLLQGEALPQVYGGLLSLLYK